MSSVTATEQTKSAIDSGNLLRAYDLAVSAINDGDTSSELRHLMVLALARMGNGEQALELFREFELDKSPDAHHRSIAARIMKDAALATKDETERPAALLAASQAYHEIFDESEDAYPGINAATLAFLGGKKDTAADIAKTILDLAEITKPLNYYDAATRAEALLIAGRMDEAAESLQKAGVMSDANAGARASSYKQLKIVSREAGLDQETVDQLLSPVSPPTVIHFCGHMFLEDDTEEEKLIKNIADYLEKNDVGYAYGALAAGSDILIAEQILEHGAELNVIFPFVQEDFIAQSVVPAGGNWLKRFDACLAKANSINFATEMHYVGDPEQFGYASKVAMGMAKLRAQYLGNKPTQLAIWDGVPSNGPAGTGADVAAWQNYSGSSEVIEAGDIKRDLGRSQAPDEDVHKRTVAAILFTDFPGFSKLSESALPAFWEGVMGNMAKVLLNYPGQILAQNSWGDALLAVTPDAPCAASLALELQTSLQNFDYALLGMTESSGMRIGLHYGPAYETMDPITGKITLYGTEVSRAARIEPVTPPGAVFVTEPFAAILALEAPDEYRCRYAGKIEFAKGYGTYPIYQLVEKN